MWEHRGWFEKCSTRCLRWSGDNWSGMILENVKLWPRERAFVDHWRSELSWQMQQNMAQPDSVAALMLINAIASIVLLGRCRFVHKQITQSGLGSNLFVGIKGFHRGVLEGFQHKCPNLILPRVPSFCSMWNVARKRDMEAILANDWTRGASWTPVTFSGFPNACASLLALLEGSTHQGRKIMQNVLYLEYFDPDELHQAKVDHLWGIWDMRIKGR
jgi:hypothetical protein